MYEGRGWGAVGAHTLGYNNVALGFCFIGNFNSTLPDQRALTAAKQAIEFGVNKVNMPLFLLSQKMYRVCYKGIF